MDGVCVAREVVAETALLGVPKGLGDAGGECRRPSFQFAGIAAPSDSARQPQSALDGQQIAQTKETTHAAVIAERLGRLGIAAETTEFGQVFEQQVSAPVGPLMEVLEVGADGRPVGLDARVVSSGIVVGAVAFHHIQRKIVVGVGAGVGIDDAETAGGVRRLSEQFQAAPHQAVITENRQIDVVLDDGVADVHAALAAGAVDECILHIRRLRPLAYAPDFR
jgi:hypothetical protein